MEFIWSIISESMKTGYISIESLLLILNGLVIFGYIKVIKPLKDRIDTMATLKDIKDTNDVSDKQKKISLDEIMEKLDKIIDNIDEIQDLDGNTYREIINMRRDVETVKQILNQFQGHMMYGGHRVEDFGNRELM